MGSFVRWRCTPGVCGTVKITTNTDRVRPVHTPRRADCAIQGILPRAEDFVCSCRSPFLGGRNVLFDYSFEQWSKHTHAPLPPPQGMLSCPFCVTLSPTPPLKNVTHTCRLQREGSWLPPALLVATNVSCVQGFHPNFPIQQSRPIKPSCCFHPPCRFVGFVIPVCWKKGGPLASHSRTTRPIFFSARRAEHPSSSFFFRCSVDSDAGAHFFGTKKYGTAAACEQPTGYRAEHATPLLDV